VQAAALRTCKAAVENQFVRGNFTARHLVVTQVKGQLRTGPLAQEQQQCCAKQGGHVVYLLSGLSGRERQEIEKEIRENEELTMKACVHEVLT
jgi:hypothetical protein